MNYISNLKKCTTNLLKTAQTLKNSMPLAWRRTENVSTWFEGQCKRKNIGYCEHFLECGRGNHENAFGFFHTFPRSVQSPIALFDRGDYYTWHTLIRCFKFLSERSIVRTDQTTVRKVTVMEICKHCSSCAMCQFIGFYWPLNRSIVNGGHMANCNSLF